MSAVALGVAAALVALRCQLITDDPYVLGSVSRVIPSTRPAFLRALNQTRRLIGCPEEGDPEEPPPLFAGGQCECTLYQVEFEVSGTSDQTGNPFTRQTTQKSRGPIGAPARVSSSSFAYTHRGSLGITSSNTPPCGGPQSTTLAIGFPSADASVTVFSVSIISGPDDCGSTPPVYPPPINFNTNIDITYEGDDGIDITVNTPFVFAPITANFDGTLRIPFTFDLGGFEFSGNINLPDFNVTVNPPVLPPGSGEDLTPVGGDEPGETVPPAPPDQKIIGVVVNCEIVQPGRVSSINFDNAPDIIAPRAASVKFAYSIGAATFWSSDIDVKTLRAFIPCPFSQGADAAIVTPYIGLESTSVPIRGFALATVNDVRQQP